MTDSELRMIETEDNEKTEGEPSTSPDSKEESSEELNTEENRFEHEEEDKKISCSLKLHAIKVGLFDVLLYIWDVVSDGLACAKHYLNCHFAWAGLTAAIMMLPALAESFGYIENWYFWMVKDWKFRLPISLICFVLFIALFTPIFDYFGFDISATIGLSFLTGLGVAIVTTFVLSTINTLKGFAALMREKPNKDGTVSNLKILEITMVRMTIRHHHHQLI